MNSGPVDESSALNERDVSVQAPYRDRSHAGRCLAEALGAYAGRADVLILGLPRGGVPVAYEVACALAAPLDVLVVRKLGVPGHSELAMGAIASGGGRVINRDVVELAGISEAQIEAVAEREERELRRRESAYRGERALLQRTEHCLILIDDGLATGASMRAAVEAVRHSKPARIVVAVPVAPPSTLAQLREVADEVICPAAPESFYAVGQWYVDFSQTSDEEVRALLERAQLREQRAHAEKTE